MSAFFLTGCLLNVFMGPYIFPPHANAWLYELLDYKCSDEEVLKQIDIQEYRVQPIPDSCALVPCENRSVPFCIVGNYFPIRSSEETLGELAQEGTKIRLACE